MKKILLILKWIYFWPILLPIKIFQKFKHQLTQFKGQVTQDNGYENLKREKGLNIEENDDLYNY